MNVARSAHIAALLPSGQVLIAAGNDQNINNLSSAEIFDPATETFTLVASLSVARRDPEAVSLADGTVMVIGGYSGPFGCFQCVEPTSEIFNRNAGPSGMGQWTTAASLPVGRVAFTANLVNNTVFIAGGQEGNTVASQSANLYDPITDSWTAMTPLITGRENQRATVLYNGTVLIVAGQDAFGALNSVEDYNATLPGLTVSVPSPGARYVHGQVLLRNKTVVVLGGQTFSGVLSDIQVYTPTTRTWAQAGTMTGPRSNMTVTLLPSGRVLIAGGSDGTTTLSTAELWTPARR
jgi:large repetitive protein